MRQSVRVLTCVVLGLALGAGYAAAQSFDVKLGQWEITIGGMAGAMGDLSKLPPQVRAQIEASLAKPRPVLSCVTAEDLKNMSLGQVENQDEACKITSKKFTSTTADLVRECTGANKRTETMHFEALSRESMRATVQSVSAARGPVNITMTGKWLGETCKEK